MFIQKKRYQVLKCDLDRLESRNMQLRADLEEAKDSQRKAENEATAEKARADALAKEVERLAELLNAKVGDCKVGVWCEGCKHLSKDSASYEYRNPQEGAWNTEKGIDGIVRFCKKHIHEICGEFEDKPKVEIIEKPVPVSVPYMVPVYNPFANMQNSYTGTRIGY